MVNSRVHAPRQGSGLSRPGFAVACLVVAAVVPTLKPARVASSAGPGAGWIGYGLHTKRAELLMLVDPTGSNRSAAGGKITGFAWSRDGSRIVLSRVDGPTDDSEASLYLVKSLHTSRIPLFTDNAGSTVRDLQPAWSPDLNTIAFYRQSAYDKPGAIFLVNRDGSDVRQLTSPSRVGASDDLPKWSPDSTRVAFLRDSPGGHRDLGVINADGTDERLLTTTGSLENWVSWSPDGTRLVFADQVGGADEVFTIRADGTDRQQLTRDGIPKYLPTWSPDGSRIVYSAGTRVADLHLFVIKPDGTGVLQLTSAPGRQISPSWAPNSRYVAYLSYPPASDQAASSIEEVGSVEMVSLATRRSVVLERGQNNTFPISWQPSGTRYRSEDGLSRH